MAKGYSKAKGRSEGGQFFALPHRVLKHENFIWLTPRANKLFLDLCVQYNGKNNGDLTTAFSIMKKRGWRSKETLYLAADELLHYGFIVRTRIGGLNKSASLFAFSFRAIDECIGKLDCKPTNAPPGDWKNQVDKWVKPNRYKDIDKRRQIKREIKAGVRNPYQPATESVPIASVKD